jgi:hypothetical protein
MGKNKISHEHYVDAIAEVQAKKKGMLSPIFLLYNLQELPLMNSRHGQLLCIGLALVLGILARPA